MCDGTCYFRFSISNYKKSPVKGKKIIKTHKKKENDITIFSREISY